MNTFGVETTLKKRDLLLLRRFRSCIYVSHQHGQLDPVQDRSMCLILFLFCLVFVFVLLKNVKLIEKLDLFAASRGGGVV